MHYEKGKSWKASLSGTKSQTMEHGDEALPVSMGLAYSCAGRLG